MSLRFFIPSARAEPSIAGPLEHVVDAFNWARDAASSVEVVVLLDGEGRLVLREAGDGTIPPKLRAQIAYHEVAAGALRYVRANTLHLLHVDLVEAAPPAPGINDPIYVHGVLTGPCESPYGSPETSLRGHLTSTRADLLDAFVLGAPSAFHYTGDGADRSPRCFHLLLAGDRAEDVAAGRGIVLAYPLLSLDVMFKDASNDTLIAQTVYDVLAPMCTELGRDPSTIPVPNRRALEQKLASDGYVIEGDVAMRNSGGVLGSVLGKWAADRVALAPEATIDDYVQVARSALSFVPGYPSDTQRALRARVSSRLLPQVSPPVPSVPRPSATVPETNSSFVRPPPSYRPSEGARKADWMSDFASPSSKSREKPPSKAKSEKPTKPSPEGNPDPDWMDDFKKR